MDQSNSISILLMLSQLAVKVWKMSSLLLQHTTESHADRVQQKDTTNAKSELLTDVLFTFDSAFR